MVKQFDLPLYEQVGFDYVKAILDLRSQLTYGQIAEAVGYFDGSSISRLLEGSVPSHRHGEAIWALYVQMFGRKPPLVIERSPTKP